MPQTTGRPDMGQLIDRSLNQLLFENQASGGIASNIDANKDRDAAARSLTLFRVTSY